MIKTSARWAGRLVLMMAVLGTIGCDRVTKHMATTTLAGQPTHLYLADSVRLGYVENAGGFLSLGASLPPGIRSVVFTGVKGLMLVALTAVAVQRSWRGPIRGRRRLQLGRSSCAGKRC